MLTLLILEPAFPDETPWWAVWWYWVMLAVIPTAAVLITRSNAKREIASTKESADSAHEVVRKIDEQVSNNHETNLRDDIDSTMGLVKAAAADASLAKEAAHRVERAVGDLIITIRASEHSADRRYDIVNGKIDGVEEDLQRHLEDVSNILSEWERKHLAQCPAVNRKEEDGHQKD